MHRPIMAGCLAVGLTVAAATGAVAFEPISTTKFVTKIDETKILPFLKDLQAVATKNGGNRAAGTPGYQESVAFVRRKMQQFGYQVTTQPFDVNIFTENAPPVFQRLSPSPQTFEPNVDVASMEYSASGDVSARLALAGNIQIPPPSEPGATTSGCAAGDFGPATAGRIALVQRGTCDFVVKARNAEAAGAVGVVIFNEGQAGRTEVLNGTLGEVVNIPVLGATFDLGRELYNQAQTGAVRVRIKVDATITNLRTFNVLAELPGARTDRTVVVGAHLDSVAEGPGINDNGSGTAALLAIAKELTAQGVKPRNSVRFAFWGAEESGLLGSEHYVSHLSDAELGRIALNLNFDMLGSPNYARFVYDGDGSTFGDTGPAGSEIIERVFQQHFANLPSSPTEFDGRSDYFAFISAGIPAGGLFSGAEGIKTAREAQQYGGRAGRPYDACYHQACDDIGNLSNKALRELGRAAAHAVYTFAMTKEDVRTASGVAVAASARKANAAALNAEYRGPHLKR